MTFLAFCIAFHTEIHTLLFESGNSFEHLRPRLQATAGILDLCDIFTI
jgi:hypothetical protein